MDIFSLFHLLILAAIMVMLFGPILLVVFLITGRAAQPERNGARFYACPTAADVVPVGNNMPTMRQAAARVNSSPERPIDRQGERSGTVSSIVLPIYVPIIREKRFLTPSLPRPGVVRGVKVGERDWQNAAYAGKCTRGTLSLTASSARRGRQRHLRLRGHLFMQRDPVVLVGTHVAQLPR